MCGLDEDGEDPPSGRFAQHALRVAWQPQDFPIDASDPLGAQLDKETLIADPPHISGPPRHPRTDTDVGADTSSSTARPRGRYALWIFSILLVVLFVGLHLTGVVGPGAHAR